MYVVKRLILQLLGIFAGIVLILFTIKWGGFCRAGVSITWLLEWENILLEHDSRLYLVAMWLAICSSLRKWGIFLSKKRSLEDCTNVFFFSQKTYSLKGVASFRIIAKLSSIYIGAVLSMFLILGLLEGYFECQCTFQSIFSGFNLPSELGQSFKLSGP